MNTFSLSKFCWYKKVSFFVGPLYFGPNFASFSSISSLAIFYKFFLKQHYAHSYRLYQTICVGRNRRAYGNSRIFLPRHNEKSTCACVGSTIRSIRSDRNIVKSEYMLLNFINIYILVKKVNLLGGIWRIFLLVCPEQTY